ncbi:MAG: hypothetical protein HWN66_18195 [Candidatus Helarchaeota archaeon]|nr:hypothetical protein [Candidatus Helarchaeota archaeon]
MRPPVASIHVEYRTVKEGFERLKLCYMEMIHITEEEFFRTLYDRLAGSYYVIDEIRMYLCPLDHGYEDSPLFLTKLRLERLGYKIVLYENPDEFFFQFSFDIIDSAFDNHPEHIILITDDLDLGIIPLILSSVNKTPIQYEIWHFLGSFDVDLFHTLTEEGIITRALDILIY